MTGEISIHGVFIHPLLLAAIFAFVAAEVIGWALARIGFYRFVWHRGLFDVALTILLWAGCAALLTGGGMAAVLG